MRMRDDQTGSLSLSGLPPFLAQLLREIPVMADPGEDPAALERIFSPPAMPATLPEIAEDWSEFVRPGLVEWFQSTRDIVALDLARMKEDEPSPELPLGDQTEPTYRLSIGARHFDAWLNALNQARLALAARFGLTETEMNRSPRQPLLDERDHRIFQVDFYGYLQEMILARMMGDDPAGV